MSVSMGHQGLCPGRAGGMGETGGQPEKKPNKVMYDKPVVMQ